MSFKDPIQGLELLCTFKIKIEYQDLIFGVSNTSNHIQIKIKMPNPSQEPPASSIDPNEDLKDINVLCSFKIKMESHGYIMGISKTSDYIQI